ncbi:hypothetical protein [Lentzea sp. E54]
MTLSALDVVLRDASSVRFTEVGRPAEFVAAAVEIPQWAEPLLRKA